MMVSLTPSAGYCIVNCRREMSADHLFEISIISPKSRKVRNHERRIFYHRRAPVFANQTDEHEMSWYVFEKLRHVSTPAISSTNLEEPSPIALLQNSTHLQ